MAWGVMEGERGRWKGGRGRKGRRDLDSISSIKLAPEPEADRLMPLIMMADDLRKEPPPPTRKKLARRYALPVSPESHEESGINEMTQVPKAMLEGGILFLSHSLLSLPSLAITLITLLSPPPPLCLSPFLPESPLCFSLPPALPPPASLFPPCLLPSPRSLSSLPHPSLSFLLSLPSSLFKLACTPGGLQILLLNIAFLFTGLEIRGCNGSKCYHVFSFATGMLKW